MFRPSRPSLERRIEYMRYIRQMGQFGLRVRTVQQVDRDELSRCIEVGRPPGQADDLPFAGFRQTVHQVPSDNAERADNDRLFPHGNLSLNGCRLSVPA